MALIKRSLSTIRSGFTKQIDELDALIAEQRKRSSISTNNLKSLDKLYATQEGIIADATKQIEEALVFKANIQKLIAVK